MQRHPTAYSRHHLGSDCTSRRTGHCACGAGGRDGEKESAACPHFQNRLALRKDQASVHPPQDFKQVIWDTLHRTDNSVNALPSLSSRRFALKCQIASPGLVALSHWRPNFRPINMESLTGLVKVSSNGVIPVALILVFVPHTLKVLSIVSNKVS